MRTRKNIAQEYDELAARSPRKNDATLQDELIVGHATDPVYLSRELNREISEMRDEVNHSLSKIKTLLVVIAIILIVILVFKF